MRFGRKPRPFDKSDVIKHYAAREVFINRVSVDLTTNNTMKIARVHGYSNSNVVTDSLNY